MVRRITRFLTFNGEFFFFPVIRKIKSQEEYKRLFSNFISLSVLQAANYIFPLITFPYLVRVLGVEKFGLISFAQAFIQYFIVLTDYGFNLSATREISINRDNKEKVSEIFSSVMMIKLGLFVLSFMIMSGIVFGFEKFRREWVLYYLTFGIVLGQVLFPVWFFQGMEQMKWITYMNVIAKGIFTIAIFIFVRTADDYYKVPLLNSVGFITAGIISFYIVFLKYNVKLYIFGIKIIDLMKHLFINSSYLFLSNVGLTLFNATNVFVLGLFADNKIVGYYSISDKIIGILIATQIPITHAMFPYFAKEITYNEKKALIRLKKILKLGLLFYFLLAVSIILFSKILLIKIFGTETVFAYKNLVIMSVIPLLGFINNIYGNQIVLNKGEYSFFMRSIIYASMVNLIFVFPLSYYFYDIGTAFSRLFAEIIFAYFCYYFASKKSGIMV